MEIFTKGGFYMNVIDVGNNPIVPFRARLPGEGLGPDRPEEVAREPSLEEITIPTSGTELYGLLDRARRWHSQGYDALVQEADRAVAIAHLFQQAEFDFPQFKLNVMSLPLPRTQMRLLGPRQARLAAQGWRVRIRPIWDAFVNANQEDRSLYNSRKLERLCEEGLTFEQGVELRARWRDHRIALLDADDVRRALDQLHLSPLDLLRFLRFLGLRREENRVLLPVVFEALQRAYFNSELSPAQSRILIDLARNEPGLRAQLGVGGDKVFLNVGRDGDHSVFMPASRLLLHAHTDYFACILGDAHMTQSWNPLGLRLGKDAPVIDLVRTSFDRATIDLLLAWLTDQSIPDPKVVRSEVYVADMRKLASLLQKDEAAALEQALMEQVTYESCALHVKVAIATRMSDLLRHCIVLINTVHGLSIHIETLPTGALRIRQVDGRLPEELVEALAPLLDKTTHFVIRSLLARKGHSVSWHVDRCVTWLRHDGVYWLEKTLVFTVGYLVLSRLLPPLSSALGTFLPERMQGWMEWNNTHVFGHGDSVLDICKHTFRLLNSTGSLLVAGSLATLGWLASRVHMTASELYQSIGQSLRDPAGIEDWMNAAWIDWSRSSGSVAPPGLNGILSTLVHNPTQGQRLESLDLSYCSELTDAQLNYLILNCPNIQNLKLGRCSGTLTALSLNNLFRLEHLRTLNVVWTPGSCLDQMHLGEQFAHRAGFALYVEVAQCPWSWQIITPSVPPFFKNLETIGTVNMRITAPDLNRRSIEVLAAWCPQLSGLEIGYTEPLTRGSMLAIASRWTRLHTIAVEGPVHSGIVRALAEIRSLRNLQLDRIEDAVSDLDIEYLVQRRPELESLLLANGRNLGNRALQALVALPNLRQLTIWGNIRMTDAGVESLLARPGPLQLVLRRTPSVSARVLARAEATTSPETAALLEQRKTDTLFKRLADKELAQSLQKVLQCLLHPLVRNRFLIDYPWPSLLQLWPELQQANLPDALVGLVVEANPEGLRETLRERLHLTAVPLADREIEVSLDQIRLIAHTLSLQKRTASHLQQVYNWLRYPRFGDLRDYVRSYISELLDLRPEGREWSAAKLRLQQLHSPLMFELLTRAIKILTQAAPLDYRIYLRESFPQMDINAVESILNRFQSRINDIASHHRDAFRALGRLFCGGLGFEEPAIGQPILAIVSDPQWRWAFRGFLDQIQRESVRQRTPWTDEEKLAVAFAGLLVAISSMLPLLVAPAERREHKEEHKGR